MAQADPAALFNYQPGRVYPMVPVHDAVATVLQEARKLVQTERVPISACHSRVLAEVSVGVAKLLAGGIHHHFFFPMKTHGPAPVRVGVLPPDRKSVV